MALEIIVQMYEVVYTYSLLELENRSKKTVELPFANFKKDY